MNSPCNSKINATRRESSSDIRKMAPRSLLIGLLFVFLNGCGGSSPATPTVLPAVLTVAFASSGALDGSNAPNANSTSNIWVAKSDGSMASPLTRLTSSGADARGPVWSPDGTKIVFVSSRALNGSDAANTVTNLWVMNADGTGATPLSRYTASGILVWDPIWSPDGRKIAFVSSAALDGSDALNTNGTVNIWVINNGGTTATPLTRLTVNPSASVWTNQPPVWSPDSSTVAFASVGALDGTNALNTNQVFNLWTAKADGSLTAPLTRLAGAGVFQNYPAWSPDGKKLAFVAQRAMDGSDAASATNSMNLWTINADGSGTTLLTAFSSLGSPFVFSPVWSPDGSKLAFGSDQSVDGAPVANASSANNVWTINANGTGSMAVTRLTASGLNFVFAPVVWSSDSRRIIMDSQRAVDGSNAANPNGNFNVWLLQADGSSAVPLTRFTSSSADSLEFSLKR